MDLQLKLLINSNKCELEYKIDGLDQERWSNNHNSQIANTHTCLSIKKFELLLIHKTGIDHHGFSSIYKQIMNWEFYKKIRSCAMNWTRAERDLWR